MKKLCRLLAIFSVLAASMASSGCSPKEATQTVVEVKPDPTMRELVSSIQIQAYALRPDVEAVLVSDEPATPVVWPVRRTFTPSSKSSSHRFRMLLSAFDAAGVEIANFTLEPDVVEDATRYVVIRLGDSCRPSKCEAGLCQALLDPEDRDNSRQEAFCGGHSDDPAIAADGGDMNATGSGRSDGPSGQTG